MLRGALAAAVTPLRDEGAALDEEAFGPYLEFLEAGGLDGILALGTTGEGILPPPRGPRPAARPLPHRPLPVLRPRGRAAPRGAGPPREPPPGPGPGGGGSAPPPLPRPRHPGAPRE